MTGPLFLFFTLVFVTRKNYTDPHGEGGRRVATPRHATLSGLLAIDALTFLIVPDHSGSSGFVSVDDSILPFTGISRQRKLK